MRSFLETNTKDQKRPKSPSDRYSHPSETQRYSHSRRGSQIKTAPVSNIDSQGPLDPRNSGNAQRQSFDTSSTPSHPPQYTSTLEIQTSSGHSSLEGLFETALIIGPRGSDEGRPIPYIREACPLFHSFGEGVDPFRTMFQSSYPRVSVERLKFLCARFFGTLAMGKHWVPTVLGSPHTFLSTLCIASAHLDSILERDVESVETSSLRQEIIHLVGQNLAQPGQGISDLNIISLIQLIASEVIGREEFSLRVNEAGLEQMIILRGGLDQLGVSGYLASTCSWVLLESAILREERPNQMYVDYCAAHLTKSQSIDAILPESPLYHPWTQFETLKKSRYCSQQSLALLDDIQAMMELFLHPQKASRRGSKTLLNYYTDITTKYRPISELRGPNERTKNDFKYEAIRITAILQATAIMRRLPLSQSLSYAATTLSTQVSSLYRFKDRAQSTDLPTSPTSPLNMRHDSMTGATTSPSYAASLASSYFDDVRSSVSSNTSSHPSISSSFSHPSFSSISTTTTTSCSTPPSTSPYRGSRHQSNPPVSFTTNPFTQHTPQPHSTTATSLLTDLKVVLESSNLSEAWQDMAGVLLWIALTLGAASHKAGNRVLEKWYSALAVRASILLSFQHPEAVHATVLEMGRVVEALGERREGEGQEQGEGVMKRRRV